MMSLSALLEPLRMANKVSGQHLYQWHIYTLDNQPVTASNGMLFPASTCLNAQHAWQEPLDNLLLISGDHVHQHYQPELRAFLRRARQRNIRLGATSTGTFLLAWADVIGKNRCTVHWEYQDNLKAEFPRLQLSRSLFELEQNLMTCSGGLAGLDMQLELITQQQGEALRNAIADQYLHSKIRSGDSAQRNSVTQRYQIHNTKLAAAIQVMEANLEEPLSLTEITTQVGLSGRQLQRLCRQRFDCSLMEFYLQLRLQQARNLLLESDLPVARIAQICGFNSSAYFTRRYRELFDEAPRQCRQR